MIAYRDGTSAMEWLSEAFGFEERARWLDEDGPAGRLYRAEDVEGHRWMFVER